MMDGVGGTTTLGTLRSRRASNARLGMFWTVAVLAAIALPWAFYDWEHARQSGFVVSMLSQMGMMIIFALSFNMLMGQAGMLSLCHACLFGFGGYCTIHFLDAAGDGSLRVP